MPNERSDRDLSRRDILSGVVAGIVGSLTPTYAFTADTESAVIAAAKTEGRGTLYAVIDPTLAQRTLDALKKKYEIDVELQRMTSGVLSQRYSTEMEFGTPLADAFITTDKVFVADAIKKNWFAPLTSLPAYAAYPAHVHTDRSAVIGHVPSSIVWNKNEIAELPADWKVLADPKYAGRLLLIDPRPTASAAQWYMLLRELYGDDFLRTLGKNATFINSVVPGMQQVAAGAKSIYASGNHQVLVPLVDKGAPLGEVFPTPTNSSDNVLALPARAPHPNIAKLLTNFYMTAECQAVLNADGFSPMPNVPGTRKLPEIREYDLGVAKAKVAELALLLGLN
jgi:iron(III) transport system substrate-binding protein